MTTPRQRCSQSTVRQPFILHCWFINEASLLFKDVLLSPSVCSQALHMACLTRFSLLYMSYGSYLPQTISLVMLLHSMKGRTVMSYLEG